ncbi:MAG: hypothetical protein IKN02_03710 [Prevotella sp.]|nr:hypothetical protein [Prevotella sp.]
MKNLFLSLAFFAMSGFAFAQKTVTIKGGTIVPVEAVKNVRATEVHIGQNVDFKVARDVIIDGVVAIPAGTIVKGNVYEAKRSMAFGTKGRLGIKLRYLNLPSGDVVNFASSDVYIQGKNRTALSVIIFCCTYLPFPCGSKAELKTGVEYDATVANNTTVTIE